MNTKLVDITIPLEQREGTEVELGAWLKQVGERVDKDEPIAELVTDKAVVELPSPAAGTLFEILVPAETKVEELGAVLGRIETEARRSEDSTASLPHRPDAPGAQEARSTEPRVPPSEGPVASGDAPSDRGPFAVGSRPASLFEHRPAPHPAVRRFALARGISLSSLPGSGANGRVTRADVDRALGSTSRSSEARSSTLPAPQGSLGPSRMVRHDPMRRAIARHMAESVQTAPHVTAVFSCDLSQVLAHRQAHKDALAARGIKLTLSAYFLRAVVEGIKSVPEVNACWREDGLEIFESIHVGVGTALEDRGLVVPVVRDVQALDLDGCAAALSSLTERARSGKLSPAEMKGSTFTLSNHGVMGSLFAAPIIINQPESAILGLGKLEKRAVVVDEGDQEQVVIRPMMYVTLTIDHRGLDAFHTNRFLSVFCETLERWPSPGDSAKRSSTS